MAGTITHNWNGTFLTITSDSGTTAMDLKGEKGDTGARGARGLPGKAGGGARIEDGVISDETTWSSSGIIDRFAELMRTDGNPVVMDNPYPNFPLQITSDFEVKQEGSGEPYPAGGGKNLLPNTMTDYTTNGITFTVNSNGTVTANGTSTARAQREVGTVELSAGDYIVSAGFITTSYTGTAFLIYTNNGSSVYVDLSGLSEKSFTLTEQKTVKYMIDIRESGNTVNNLVYYPMIRKATETDSTYEPYSNIRPIRTMSAVNVVRNGETFTMSLGGDYCCGSIDWNRGVFTAEWGYKALDGTENWSKGTGANNFYTSVNTMAKLNDYTESIKCSTFKTIGKHAELSVVAGISGYYDKTNNYPSENWIYINNGVSTTAAEIKEWLAAQHTAGTPVQVAYKLATPIEIQLTPQEIKAIKGTNTLTTDADTLSVYGRVDTMYQLSRLAERVAALEALIK